jgi:hypothetical protein
VSVLWRPIEAIGSETVTAKAELEEDANGDPIEGIGAEFDVVGCSVSPRNSSEDNFRSATTTEDMVLLAPVYETDLSAQMTITWRGQTYTIEGEPAPWVHLDGEYAGTQANLKRGS